jgi:hypothetical protein
MAFAPDGRLVFARAAWGETHRLGWIDVASGARGEHDVDLALPPNASVVALSLAFPRAFGGRVMQLACRLNAGALVNRYVHDSGGALLVAKSQDEVKGQLGRATRPRAPPRQPPPPKPPPEPKKKPKRPYSVRTVGSQSSSQEGVLSVLGYDVVGLFDADGETLLFAPPDAVAIAPVKDRVLSWRVTKRAGASGVARGDYDWTLEVYAWPRKELVGAHVVTSRDVIAWCWPLELRCPKASGHRVAALHCRSEDYRDCVYVVMHRDGRFTELRDRAEALRVASAQSG